MKTPTYYKYSQNIPNSRMVSFRTAKTTPRSLETELHKIGIDSATELLEFISAREGNIEVLKTLYEIQEDEAARLIEKLTAAHEKNGVADIRCGDKTNPCHVIPKNDFSR